MRHFAAGAVVGAVVALAFLRRAEPTAPSAPPPPRVHEGAPPPASGSLPLLRAAPERRAELELEPARETIRELERELYGEPLPWPDDLPPEHHPDFVRATMERAVRDCDVPARLLIVDCQEAPCYGVLEAEGEPGVFGEGGWYAALVDCPTWRDAWDGDVRLVTDEVRCPDGTTRSFAMISPWVALDDAPDGSDEQRTARENAWRRQNARAANARPSVCF